VPKTDIRIDRALKPGLFDITSAKDGSGKAYDGTIKLERLGHVYSVLWQLRVGAIGGLGLHTKDGMFVAAYGATASYGLGVYKIDGGSMDGLVTGNHAPGQFAHQHLEGPKGLSGSYAVTSRTSVASGTMRLKKVQQGWDVTFSLSTGTFQGAGIRVKDTFVVGWTLENHPVGVAAYEVHGKRLRGTWMTAGTEGLGVENWKRQKRKKK